MPAGTDSPYIENLLVFWLAVAARVGPVGNLYLPRLLADTSSNGLREDLRKGAKISRKKIDAMLLYISNTPGALAEIQAAQQHFHEMVKIGVKGTADSATYEGDACPFAITRVLPLTPVAATELP